MSDLAEVQETIANMPSDSSIGTVKPRLKDLPPVVRTKSFRMLYVMIGSSW